MTEPSLMIAGELTEVLTRVDSTQTRALADTLAKAPAVFAAGAGRSGFMVKAALMRLMHMGTPAWVVGEMATPAAKEGDVLLLGSGSGETATLIAIAQKAKTLGLTIALVTINRDSTLGRMADVVVEVPAPTPKRTDGGTGSSLQPMGSLFEQALLLILDGAVLRAMDLRHIDGAEMFTRHANLE